MGLFKNILLACALAGSLGWAANVLAADSLPDSKMGGATRTAADAMKRDAVCTRCHDESEPAPILSIYQTRHGVRADARTPTCQSCHGESEKHLKGDPNVKGRAAPDRLFKKGTYPASDAAVQSEACMACHKSGLRTHWDGSQHQSRDVPCSSCHKVHVKSDPVLTKSTQPDVCYTCHKTQRAETHKISTHPLAAGKMGCSDCHNPHGSTGPKLLIKNNVNETCYTCHAEKRGPFLWEHGPVVDDCTNCHTPHGSTNPTLLKARTPWLCQECHSGDHGAQQNSGANLAGGANVTANGVNPLASAAPRAQLAARACLNCHVLVHGSNHPAGAKFQR
jgi:DmsE family decaheme c-type cytochrome